MGEPTVKDPAIETVLRNLSGSSRPTAIRNNECVWCKVKFEDVDTHFRDALSKKEYNISGMCQSCQDKTFGVSDE
jgi:hypothetical protein